MGARKSLENQKGNLTIVEQQKKELTNPIRAYYQAGIDKLASDYEIAKMIPEKMISFMTKCLNIWVQATNNSYMDISKWKACEVKELPYDIAGKDVFIGFDMSAKIDLTSVAFIIPIKNETGTTQYIVFSHSFVPNIEKLQEREMIDKMPYMSWAKHGYITITNSQVVDQDFVWEYVIKFCEEHKLNIDTLCFDPANSSKMMMDLSNQGFKCVEVYQSHKSLNESTAGFREQVYEQNIFYTYNPVLNFAMKNAVIKQNNGLIKIDKDSESFGKMQWEKREITVKKGKEKKFDNELDILLNIRPNPYMSAITFWQTVELNRNHYGNSYVYIERDKIAKIKYLWQLPSDEVEIWIDNKGIFGMKEGVWYVWNDKRSGKKYSFFKDEILHFKSHMSWDGLSGIPVREILRTQLNTQKS